MKKFYAFFIMLVMPGLHLIVSAQEKGLKDRTFKEIVCFIENPYEFLGKSDSAILLAGRPVTIKGGDMWETTTTSNAGKNSPGKNGTNFSGAIVVGTGCGALTMTLSEKSMVVNTLIFVPHKKAKVDGADILNFFKDKYSFEKNECVIETKDSEFIRLVILKGAILIVAWDKEKNDMKYAD